MDFKAYNHLCYLLNKLLTFIYAPSYKESAFGGETESDADRNARIERYAACEKRAMEATEDPTEKSQKRRGHRRHSSISDMTLFGVNNPPFEMLAKRGTRPNKLHQSLLRSIQLTSRVLQHALQIELTHMKRVNEMNQEAGAELFAEETKRSENWLFDIVKKSV